MANYDVVLQVGHLSNVLDLRLNDCLEKISFDMEAGFKQRTPVDTGRCRSGWITSIDAASDFVPPPVRKGAVIPSPADTSLLALGGQNLPASQIFITNGVEYAQYLEGGSSQQAPAGMVAVTVEAIAAEIDLVIEKAVRDNPS